MSIHAISREEFDRFRPMRHPRLAFLFEEAEWFMDETSQVIGVLTRDRTDSDWGFTVLTQDKIELHFRAIDYENEVASGDAARNQLQERMSQISSRSKNDVTRDLFNPIVPEEMLHPIFKDMAGRAGHAPARQLMNEVYQDFDDADGNFLQQFQTTGCEARTFELYLHAFFSRSGYAVERNHKRPDFIIQKDAVRVAIEATTANPTQMKDSTNGADPFSLNMSTPEEIKKTINERLPIKLGSPLFSKLKMKYWELAHCKGIPLVLIIQSFQEEGSLAFSDASLGQYLYGMRHSHRHDQDGSLIIEKVDVSEHTVGGKVIPSCFFGQPDAENVSAVVFCNSGTVAKFNRMAYQAGVGRRNLDMERVGFCYNADPNAAEPLSFSYDVDDPPAVETWGQGLAVFSNPNANYPLPNQFFVDAARHYIEDGRFTSDVPPFHPMISKTITFNRTADS